jgi:hypothetical protein
MDLTSSKNHRKRPPTEPLTLRPAKPVGDHIGCTQRCGWRIRQDPELRSQGPSAIGTCCKASRLSIGVKGKSAFQSLALQFPLAQAGAQHSQSPVNAEGGAVILKV